MFQLSKPRPLSRNPRILIIRTDRLGDLVLSTPVIQALRSNFPEGFLAMMIRSAYRELIEGNPDLNEVILFDKQGSERSLFGMLRLAWRLRRKRFDVALILHSTNRVLLVSWLAGIRRRVGYARRLGFLLTDRLPYLKPQGDRHELRYNLDLLKLLGVQADSAAALSALPSPTRLEAGTRAWSADSPSLRVCIPPDAQRGVARFLSSRGVQPGESLIVLHPGASCPSKRWAPERFAALGDLVIERLGAKVLILTGPHEIRIGREVLRAIRQPALEALGFFRTVELAPLFQRSICLVSNDSGPVHVAAAVGTPVVAIFGRWGGGLSPTRWGPTGPKSIVLHRDVGCRPCLAHRCPIGFVCLSAITVEEVFASVEHLTGLRHATP